MTVDVITGVEKLLWKKAELKKLHEWMDSMTLTKTPVNGIHWAKLKSQLNALAEELQEEIRVLEAKIQEAVKDIKVDV